MSTASATMHYCRDATGVLVACRCGHPAGKPVMIGDQVICHLCEDCWDTAVADSDRRKDQYQALVDQGAHPRMADRWMCANPG